MSVPEGWIEHDGGWMPQSLDAATPIKVRWRNGPESDVKRAGYFIWRWISKPRGMLADLDIIAYKPEPSHDPT